MWGAKEKNGILLLSMVLAMGEVTQEEVLWGGVVVWRKDDTESWYGPVSK